MYIDYAKLIDELLKIIKILWCLTGTLVAIICVIIIIVFFEIIVFKNDKFDNSFLGKRCYFITQAIVITVVFGNFALAFSIIYIVAVKLTSIFLNYMV